MTREEAIKELRRLHYAYKADEHGDYFYDNADDVCQAAAVAISALREQDDHFREATKKGGHKWISVEERLPEESGVYLVYDIPLGFRVFYYGKSEVRSGWAGVTHWMPLPEPPTEEEV